MDVKKGSLEVEIVDNCGGKYYIHSKLHGDGEI
jgi:hypothetical protein